MFSVRYAVIAGVLFLGACGDDGSGGGAAGGGGSGGEATGGTSEGGGGSTSDGGGGGSGCVEITVDPLGNVTANGDYNYGSETSPIGGDGADQYVLELYNGLDTPEVDLASDSKNGKPSTCEACGWIFEDGNGIDAARIYYHESGTISLTVPNFGNELETEPDAGTITDITFREVALGDPPDLYTATFVADGACVHLSSASF